MFLWVMQRKNKSFWGAVYIIFRHVSVVQRYGNEPARQLQNEEMCPGD
jgi:hypothetical protein